MFAKCFRPFFTLFLALALVGAPARLAFAQDGGAAPAAKTHEAPHSEVKGGESEGKAEKPESVFGNEQGTYLGPIARAIFGRPAPVANYKPGEAPRFHNVDRDWVLVTLLVAAGLLWLFVGAAKKAKIRPEGKASASHNMVEAAVDGFQDYLISVMGEGLARKYTPLISSFFFTILVCNWLGLIPGLLAPTSIPTIPISLALAAFFCVHFIAIKEAGVKSWFMHFVGEPIWLAPLNFPLHIVGELVKPVSLSLRLLCNVFGEEQVVIQLTVLAMTVFAAIHLPIPFQLPMLFLGTFFGFLQALVFSTLLAIYISILATHHDDHDAHNNHGHVEHDDIKGRHQIIAHPSETTLA